MHANHAGPLSLPSPLTSEGVDFWRPVVSQLAYRLPLPLGNKRSLGLTRNRILPIRHAHSRGPLTAIVLEQTFPPAEAESTATDPSCSFPSSADCRCPGANAPALVAFGSRLGRVCPPPRLSAEGGEPPSSRGELVGKGSRTNCLAERCVPAAGTTAAAPSPPTKKSPASPHARPATPGSPVRRSAIARRAARDSSPGNTPAGRGPARTALGPSCRRKCT